MKDKAWGAYNIFDLREMALKRLPKGIFETVDRGSEDEIALLYPLICARLAVSVTNSAYRTTLEPDDPYITISEAPAWAALEQLTAIHPRFAHYSFRHACGLAPVGYAGRAW